MKQTYVPYGGYWSSPFCRWQGSLQGESSLELAARTAKSFLGRRDLAAEHFDGIALGVTVPQPHSFYGAPWVAGMMGAPGITGPTISQACATSVGVMSYATTAIAMGQRGCVLAVTCDRTSNGPHIYYPNPRGVGGSGTAETPVLDNFNLDPYAGKAMIETAENVAAETGITREELDQVTLLRYEQYRASLADDRAFQRRYMAPVEIGRGKRARIIDEDEGIHDTDAAGLAKLRPVVDGGATTFGTQTHPADGNAGIILCTEDRAAELSCDNSITIRIVSFGEARVKKGFMPMAVVPAARQALARAELSAADCRAIKTHNPFAINDVYMCRELGLELDAINRYGSSLVYGHPQGPTGTRAIVELIEELVIAGGGYGMFTGCAAGDTAMALVLEVR